MSYASFQRQQSFGEKHIDQWEGIKIPQEPNHLTFDKDAKVIKWGKNSLFNKLLKLLDSSLYRHRSHNLYKINSKCIQT